MACLKSTSYLILQIIIESEVAFQFRAKDDISDDTSSLPSKTDYLKAVFVGKENHTRHN